MLCTLYSLHCTDYRVQTKQHRSPVLFEQKCVSFSIDADAPFSLLYFLREKENRIHIENVSHFADPSGHFFYHFRNHFLCLSLALYSYIFIHVFRLNIFIYWHRSSCPKFTAKNCLCKSRKSWYTKHENGEKTDEWTNNRTQSIKEQKNCFVCLGNSFYERIHMY